MEPKPQAQSYQTYQEWRDSGAMEQALQDAVANKTLLNQPYEEQTRSHLDQAAPAAARSIIGIALYSTDEKRRLEAAKYVVDRQLGRIGEEKQNSLQTNPLEDLLADVVQTAEAFVKGSTESKEGK
jgi:hypothetical protein